MSEFLSREQIVDSFDDLVTDIVEVPEWSGKVRVRELTASEAEGLGVKMVDKKGNLDARQMRGISAKIVQWGAVKPDSLDPLFTKKDVTALGRKSNRALKRVAAKIMELSDLVADESRPWSLECPHCEKEFEVDLVDLEKQYTEAHDADEDDEDDDPKN